MKRIKRYIAMYAIAAATITPSVAQEFRSSYFMETSNFRHQMNPALLDSTYFSFILGNVNVGTTGNIGAKNFIYDYNKNGYRYTTFMNPEVDAQSFLNELNDKNRADVYLNYNLLSLAFKGFKGVNLVELNLRSNTNIALPYELFEFAKLAGQKEHYQINNLGARSQNYIELALGHSHKINDRLTVGAKMKFLLGAAYADFHVNHLDITMNGDLWRLQGDARLKASLMDSRYEFDREKLSADGRPRLDGFDEFKVGSPSFGMAFDFGAVYKLTDDITLSAAVTDLGFIKWKNIQNASSAGDYTFDGFDDIFLEINGNGENNPKADNTLDNQFDRLGDDLEEMFAVYDDGVNSGTQSLAATINVGAQYQLPVYRKLSFGLLYTSRINGKYSWHEGMVSANIRPLKWIEATVNTSMTSTGWTYGAALSLKAPHFNFYIGADRFMGKVSKQFIPLNKANTNINLGMTFPL